MIPIHSPSKEYEVYRCSYVQHANKILDGNGDAKTFALFCQSLFHYSFNIIPDQRPDMKYTPAAVAFQVPGLIAQGVNDTLTKLAEFGLSSKPSQKDTDIMVEDALFDEVADAMKWDKELVRRTLMQYSAMNLD